MYIEGLFNRLAKLCTLLAVVFSLCTVLILIMTLTSEYSSWNLLGRLIVFLPVASLPGIFGLLSFCIKRITQEMADNQRAVSEDIK